ncbi:MAG: primosomal protein N' [Alphaproteobacteria bacterium]|nr:primosomal protein N' [Alphaproteobacteria bacterium]
MTSPDVKPKKPPLQKSAPARDAETARRVTLLLPVPLNRLFDYALNQNDPEPVAGQYVSASLGSRQMIGVVMEKSDQSATDTATQGLKYIDKIYDLPPMSAPLRKFILWMTNYTMSPMGAVLRLAISVPQAIESPRAAVISPRAIYYRRTASSGHALADKTPSHDPLYPESESSQKKPPRLSPQGKKVLEFLADGTAQQADDLITQAEISLAVLKNLAAKGFIHAVDAPPIQTLSPLPQPSRTSLNPSQQTAASALATKIATGKFSVSLLDGVTGSGKTEVYFAAIDEALRQNRQSLILLPEIALSLQWLTRFRQYFGFDPLIWHSGLTPRTRRDTWRQLAHTTQDVLARNDRKNISAKIVVGARSALFLPFADLGLIVVDEEHDQGYKQEDGVLYHARDMAVIRGKFSEASVILASATPSLETLSNVTRGRFDRLYLPERPGGAVLPQISLLDLRVAPPPVGKFLSEELIGKMTKNLASGEQSLLFLNRRGYAPLTLCRGCGFRFSCRHCTSWLVEHRRLGRLVCHLCGANYPMPRLCPECGVAENFAACGPGVERIAEEVAHYFPQARRAIMASDVVEGEEGAAQLVEQMVRHEIDILIGTQMIAKGHHFPDLTLVGVVDADLGLSGGDMRAGEKTWQILHQVAGRAGREDRPGQVILQTSDPQHAVMQALVKGDRDEFLRLEMAERERHVLPPFARLAAVIVSSEDANLAEQTARELGRKAPQSAEVTVFGPAPAPLAKWRDRYRYRLLMKTPRQVLPQPIIRAWLASVSYPATVRVAIDIDPMSFL